MSASPDLDARQRSNRGGEPLRAPVNRALRARYAALFADDIAQWLTLLAHTPASEARCLELDARAGHGAAALRARGARAVWAMVQSGPEGDLYGGEAHHLIRGDLAWLHTHPDLQAAKGFDLIVCAALQWALPREPDPQAEALRGLRALLNPQGRLLFGWPARCPRQQPSSRTTPSGVRIIEQRVDRTHWQCRLKTDYAPWIQQGATQSPSQCARSLARAGFCAINQRRLDPRSLCFEATR